MKGLKQFLEKRDREIMRRNEQITGNDFNIINYVLAGLAFVILVIVLIKAFV